MTSFLYPRRDVLRLLGGAAVAAAPALRAFGAPGPGDAFSVEAVTEAARRLADGPFLEPDAVPRVLAALDYDRYRQIRYRKERAVWGRSPTRFSVELFAPGFLFEYGVDVQIVENGRVRPVPIGPDAFEVPDPALGEALARFGQFAGFRLHYPLNRDDYRDEFVVFQGASYFRAVSRGQAYGLSARGLAIDVAEPTGEEFPVFRRFWIERPSADDNAIVVHALLDSQRCTGAFRFAIYPGSTTTLDVDATLFPRERLEHVGVAPLTSMFMHGPMDGPDVPDHRPRVHDSLGLALHTGAGEHLWRPLQNPSTLQLGAFVDDSPRGFGLIQRERDFDAFQDLEARYERRPSAWVAPRGDWGPGHVQLVEIPSDEETNDNIVAYWRPRMPLEAGTAFPFAYRLTWPDRASLPEEVGRITRCAQGRAFGSGLPQLVLDIDRDDLLAESLEVRATTSAGRIVDARAYRNDVTGGVRVAVIHDPGDAPLAELRVQLLRDGAPVAETLLHRWLGA